MERLVEIRNKQVVVSSRQVAEAFGKEHRNVLADIREIISAENSALTFYQENTYTAGTGKRYPEYLMNRDGFSLLAMGFTGKKALEWKIKYIQAFSEMESMLQKQSTPTIQKADEKLTIKWYQGKPVMTTKDLAPILGVQSWNVFAAMKKWCIQDTDYILLTGEPLRKFKEENRGAVSRGLAALTMITESGIRKLCNVYRKAFPQELFWEKRIAPSSKDKMLTAIEKLCSQLRTIEGVLRHYPETVLKGAEKNAILSTAQDMSLALSVDVYRFKQRYEVQED